MEIKVKIFSENLMRNGDTEYFTFVSCGKLKTYGFLSKIQKESLEKDGFLFNDEEFSEKTTFYSKKYALENKKYINIGLFYLIRDGQDYQLSTYKKNDVLDLILSDKPALFYSIKNGFDYKKISDFRFHDFKFDKDFLNNKIRVNNSICYKIKNFKSSNDLAEFVFGEKTNESKRIVMNIILKKGKEDYRINYELVRIIFFLRQIFSLKFIYSILENKEKTDRLQKSSLFKDILYYPLNEKNGMGILKYINEFESEKKKLNELIRFNIPHHILSQFSEVMDKAFDQLRPDVKKASDALYFFNNLSRDYGRLNLKNFKLNMLENKNFKKEIFELDELVFNEFKFVIPKDYLTLIDWGSKLNNCVGNYHSKEDYFNKLLIGVFKNGQLTYLISIKGSSYKEIAQIKGFKNSSPKLDDLSLIFEKIKGFLTNPEDNYRNLCKYKGDNPSLL